MMEALKYKCSRSGRLISPQEGAFVTASQAQVVWQFIAMDEERPGDYGIPGAVLVEPTVAQRYFEHLHRKRWFEPFLLDECIQELLA